MTRGGRSTMTSKRAYRAQPKRSDHAALQEMKDSRPSRDDRSGRACVFTSIVLANA